MIFSFFFFKQKTAYEIRISDWSSDVCSSDLVGIAHTRWATHGGPTTSNAHPHATREVALVHNGIIENFKPLRDELIARGRHFDSETDTEVVAHLVSEKIEAGMSPEDAVREVLPRLHGAFALAILLDRKSTRLT